jgi:hypothetical protein
VRIFYVNIGEPKRLAKAIAHETNAKLMTAQQAVARASGYRDWFELTLFINQEPTNCRPVLSARQEVSFAITVATMLNAEPNDVLRGISLAGVFSENGGVKRSLEVATSVFRATSIPDRGKRQPGSVGKFKYNSRPPLLRQFGSLTRVLFHRCRDGGVADFEYVTPRQTMPLFIPAALYLAYGFWKLADGSIVLHSRDYLPMWHIIEGQKPRPLNPADWIQHIDRGYFWDDVTAPWDSQKRIDEEHQRLESFGISGMPKLVDVLPDLIFADDHLSIRGSVEKRFGPTSNVPHLHDHL